MAGQLAKSIEVDIRNHSVIIDGETFPYFITEDGVEAITIGGPGGLAAIRMTVLAEHVVFIGGDDVVEGTEVIRNGVGG